MRHESFYVAGKYSDDRLNIQLSWALHPNSFSDCVPVTDDRRDLVLVFYGEDFSGSAKPDARSLIRLYEQLGESFLGRLNGWFSGVLLDFRHRKALLFNDRYGMQRLYYHDSDEAFYFASEAKALLQLVPSLKEVNHDALAEYIAFDCVLGNKSLFRGVSVLPGGSCWNFDPTGRCNKKQYYSADDRESVTQVSADGLIGRLQRVFLDIVPKYVQTSERVAVSLTGGLDSRLIVAAAGNIDGLPAYTYAGARDTFDVRQARQVARVKNLNHSVVRLGRDFFDGFSTFAERTIYISDGEHGVSGAHNLYLSRIARQFAPVRLTGLYGSEVLRQGRILPLAAPVNGLLSHDFIDHVRQAEQRVAEYRQGNPLTAALHRDIPWRGHGSLCIERSQVTVRSPFMDNDLVDLLYGIPNAVRHSKKVQLELIQSLDPQLGRILSNYGHATGRNPAMLSVVRAFLWSLFKADYMYFFDPPSWFVKIEPTLELLHVPQVLCGFRKFEHYRKWYRTIAADYVRDTLLDQKARERSFFNVAFLRKAVDEHLSGKKNHRNVIDKALTLELIVRQLIERKVSTCSMPPDEKVLVRNSP